MNKSHSIRDKLRQWRDPSYCRDPEEKMTFALCGIALLVVLVKVLSAMHVYEVSPRKDKRGVDLICNALPFEALWYGAPNAAANAVSYAKFYSRSQEAVIRLFDAAGNLIETHKHEGGFKEA